MEKARAAGQSEFTDPNNPTGPKIKVENFREALPPLTDPNAIAREAAIRAARESNQSFYIDPVSGRTPVPPVIRDRVSTDPLAGERARLIAAARASNQATYVDPVTKQAVPVPPVRNREVVERTVMVQSPTQQRRIADAKGRGEDYYRQWLATERERLRAEASQIGESGYLDPETNQWVSLTRNRGSEFDTTMITAADIDPMTGQQIVHRPGEVVQGIQPMLRGEIHHTARKAGDDLDIIATPEGEDIEERLRKGKGKPDDTMLATNDFSQGNQLGRASVEGDPQMIVPSEGGQAQLRPDQLDAQGQLADGQPGQPQQIDPQTGLPIDPRTGLPIDPRTGLPFNPQTGQYFDPRTGQPIHPNQAYQMGLQAGGGMLLNEQQRARQQGQQPGQSQQGQPGQPQPGQPGQLGQFTQQGQGADDKTVFVPDHGLTPDISNLKGPDKKKLRGILGDAFGRMNEEGEEKEEDEDEEGKDKQGPDPNDPPPWAR